MDGLKRRGHDSRRDTDVEPRLSRDGAIGDRPFAAALAIAPCSDLNSLQDLAYLIEIEARQALEDAVGVSLAQSADEVRTIAAIGEELGVDSRIVEAGHRPAVLTDSTRCDHEVCPL